MSVLEWRRETALRSGASREEDDDVRLENQSPTLSSSENQSVMLSSSASREKDDDVSLENKSTTLSSSASREDDDDVRLEENPVRRVQLAHVTTRTSADRCPALRRCERERLHGKGRHDWSVEL